MENNNFIFDTTIFRKILDGLLDLSKIIENKDKTFSFFITYVQKDELMASKNPILKNNLLKIFNQIPQKQIPTESFVLGVSRLGMAKLSNGDLLEKLRKGNFKHTEDALIGETAIKNNLILVTTDILFKKRVNKEGGNAINLKDFLKI